MKKLSLKNRLFCIIAAIIVVLTVLICAVTYSVFRNIIMGQIAESRVDVLRQIGERTSIIKKSMSYISNLCAYDIDVQRALQKPTFSYSDNKKFTNVIDDANNKYKNAFKLDGFDYNLEVYGANGLAYITNGTKKSFDSVKNELWYKQVLTANDKIRWISRFDENKNHRQYLLGAARTVKNDADQVTGIIIVTTKESFLKDSYKNVLTDSNDIYIVDETGTIVSNKDYSMLGLNYFNMNRLHEIAGNTNYTIINNSYGSRLISKYTDVDSGWTIVESVDTHSIFTVLTVATAFIIIFGLCIMGGAMIFAYHAARKTTQPLREFGKYMEKVENGDIEVVSSVQGWKEIEEINEGFNRMIAKLRTLMQDIKQKEREKHTIELDFLQAQINPHFLHNTLFSVKCLIAMGKTEQAEGMLSDFIELLRMTLGKNNALTTLQNEIECVQKYVNIQNYRYAGGIELFWECDSECLDMQIPRLMLQPIVENAIFHGIEPKGGSGMIVIQAIAKDELLQIDISDDGIGMDDEAIKKVMRGEKENRSLEFNSVGLANVVQRVKLNYGEKYGVSISSSEFGTKISIFMPAVRGKDNEHKDNGR